MFFVLECFLTNFVLMKKALYIFFLFPFLNLSQTFSSEKFGASVGCVVSLGTHVTSLGFKVDAYYSDYFYQVNAGTTIRFNGKSYGERKQFIESRNSLGLVLLAGKRESALDFQLDGLHHNTGYNYGLAYNYLWYFDNAGTSQRSGGWGAHIKNVSLLFENDVFGGQAKDRFRTGHLAVIYKMDDFKFSTGLQLWTGETANSTWQRISMDKCPSGFRVLEDLPYGKTSHGILYAGFNARLPYGQIVNARIGIDSEQIRHGVQNRFTHDLILFPKKIERNTPHYPRLDEEGCPVFTKDSIRNPRLFLQFSMNENWSN
jgi:hypothetical protein